MRTSSSKCERPSSPLSERTGWAWSTKRSSSSTWIDELATFQAVPAWRETAWRNAEALVNAPTPAARALVEDEIETYADSQAKLIRSATAYPPLADLLGRGTRVRDAYCADNWQE
jgi:hypothetical protein